nr:phage head closure protein [Pannonibacter sp. XCT-53]
MVREPRGGDGPCHGEPAVRSRPAPGALPDAAPVSGAGAYRLSVRLWRPELSVAANGQATAGLTDIGLAFAELAGLSQGEAVAAGRLDGGATHRMTLRFRADITGGWRVTAEGHSFRVLAARDRDGRRRQIELMLEEEGA